MRFEDFTDWLQLRRLTSNPLDVVRYRKRHRPGLDLTVAMRSGPPIHLRGGYADHHMFHRIFLRDEYRLRTLPTGSLRTVVDIGGNVGMFARRAALDAERVVSCEPVPANFAQLERNVAGMAGVTPLRVAVGAENGTATLYEPKEAKLSGQFSTFADGEGEGNLDAGRAIECERVSLDTLFEHENIDRCELLKLDVEGAEYDILHGAAAETLQRIERIHAEYHDVRPDDPRTRIENLAAFLEHSGFAVEVVPHERKANHGMVFARRRAPGARS